MDFNQDKVRPVVNEDRLSSLPDEILHQILSFMDTKFTVQTCLLASRWKFLWTSMPCLSFHGQGFDSHPKFDKFVSNVLSHRNHQIQVSSVKLDLDYVSCQDCVSQIVSYAFSRNIQNLTVMHKNRHALPFCLFSSQSLKHLTLSTSEMESNHFYLPWLTSIQPLDFPALTTLHLNSIALYGYAREPGDLISKCVNLKNLTLKNFIVPAVEAFDIITPRLSNLTLINGKCTNVVNLIAPQLENLTIIDCSIKYLKAPPGLSSLYYSGDHPLQLSKDGFYSLNKVTLNFKFIYKQKSYKKIDARETINMLQELHSARFLTVNLDIVECLSSFPHLLLQHPSPFSNLIRFNIDSSRKEPYKVKVSTETKKFFLENSPNATFTTDLPEEPPTKAMLAKLAKERRMAKLLADIKSCMTELQALLDQINKLAERKEVKENKVAVENLVAELQVWRRKRIMQSEPERAQIDAVLAGLMAEINARMEVMQDLIKHEYDNVVAVNKKQLQVISLLRELPKRQRAEMEARYSHQFQHVDTLCIRLFSGTLISDEVYAFKKKVSDNFLIFQDDSSCKLPLASQPSSSAIMPKILPA